MIHSFFTSLPPEFDLLFGFAGGVALALLLAACKGAGAADEWLQNHLPSDPTRGVDDLPDNISSQVPSGRGGPGSGLIQPDVGRISHVKVARGGLKGITALQISKLLK